MKKPNTKPNLFFPVLFLSIISLLFCSCETENLTSDNYWGGATEERLWVEKHYSAAAGGTSPAVGETAGETAAEGTEAGGEAEIPPAKLKEDGSKFRIAVIISGEYWEFFDNLKGLIEGFANIGWARNIAVPANLLETRQLMDWLAGRDYSDFVEFPQELFFNLEWGDNSGAVEEAVIKNIPDADLVIAYGGMAARMLYQQEDYPLPVIADAITDAVAAGVTLSETDSGKAFFSNKIDSEMFRKQIRLFHDICGFEKLGIVYGDDENGVVYGAVRDVEAVAKEKGFQIIRNTNVKEEMDDDTVDLYLAALKDVASRADAVYIGASTAVTEYDIINQIVSILDNAGVPSFALEGSIRVKDGILFSMASSGMIRSGIYTATKAANIFYGAVPQSLDQRFESLPSVAVNLATANKIGLSIPVEIIVNSDEIYVTRDGSDPVNRKQESHLGTGFTNYAQMAGQAEDVYLPRRRSDGSRFRIAVLQSGVYWEFNEHFRGLLTGLSANGWAAPGLAIPKDMNIEEMLDYVGDEFSEYVEFPRDFLFDLEWGRNIQTADKLFTGRKIDVDLIICMGGVGGRLFTRYSNYPVPVLMEGITDPIATGVIYSLEDSGRDFVTCRVDPSQYQRQVQLFHDFVGFKTLGILYGDNDDGRLYSAVNDVELVARRRGFEIVRNTNVKEEYAPDTTRLYLAALKDLAGKVDAVYLGASTALTEYDIMDDVVKILNDAKVPSFALEGEIRVKEGAMLGISSLEAEKFGVHNANKTAAILSGVTPRLLKQTMEGLPSIVLNLDTAQAVGFDVPLSLLATVDQIVLHQGGGLQ